MILVEHQAGLVQCWVQVGHCSSLSLQEVEIFLPFPDDKGSMKLQAI